MTDYTVSGVAHDPDTDAPLAGLWRVRIYEPITGVHPDELLDEIREGQDVAAYSRPGREASVTLAETTGSQLYWCVFNSDDRQSTIGPLLFTLTEDRTWDDIIANPSPVPSGGGSGDSVSRGTLYLKASCVNADASTETWADGTGSVLALTLDTERMGSSPVPPWAILNGDHYDIRERAGQGLYLMSIGGAGSVEYDDVPASVYIDIFPPSDTILGASGCNYGWSSSGSDNSPPFTPMVVTPLDPGAKDATSLTQLNLPDLPVSLAGIVAANYGPTTDNPRVTMDILFSITQVGSGVRYTDADFA